jgi:Domain of unknown function (DUF4132)
MESSGSYDTLIRQLAVEEYNDYRNPFSLKASPVGQRLLKLTPEEQIAFVFAAIDWLTNVTPKPPFKGRTAGDMTPSDIIRVAVFEILRRRLPLNSDNVAALLQWTIRERDRHAAPRMVKIVEDFLLENKMTFSIEEQIGRLIDLIKHHDAVPELRRALLKLQELRDTKTLQPPIDPDEAWSDVALADLATLEEPEKIAWVKLLNSCALASGSSPTAKWLKATRSLLEEVGFPDFKRAVLAWFPLVDKPRTRTIRFWNQWEPDPNNLITTKNADILKGLVWLCALQEDKEIARALMTLAVSAYRKVPLVGPRCVRVGNACVWALGEMPGSEGVSQLALLKAKVKTPTTQKGIRKALDAAAKRIGLPSDEIEEMAVPTYGLQEVGTRREELAGFTVELAVTGTAATELRWFKPDGKKQSSVPQAVKEQHAEELKELNQSIKDIRKMLPAQAARIENLYLERKTWTLAAWRERYLDHPLVGTIARRLIWKFTSGEQSASGIWLKGQIVGLDGSALNLDAATKVELWHPLSATTADVMRWRELLVEHELQQPFKQAHREIYLLTDAERHTGVYSNRFAAHVIKQHQFHALANARGWKNKLRLMVDDFFPPATREMPAWSMRAEFWIEGIGETYEQDTTAAGTFLFLSTDQVRFYGLDADSDLIAVDRVPPLVFSEIMRDVDLFIGVASVANDPTWSDGGPDGRYGDYWSSYSFGDLTETAKTRKQVLEKLIPRLKIADRCTLLDRFLIVRGDVRTYKIHLGSGNILMEPHDQYLCIVPNRSVSDDFKGKVFLPFEGDGTLSIILSKAFLLAADWKITDPTILHQIGAAAP